MAIIYQLVAPAPPITDVSTVVKRTDDAGAVAFIPFDETNADYQQYLAWLAAGNTVLPADE